MTTGGLVIDGFTSAAEVTEAARLAGLALTAVDGGIKVRPGSGLTPALRAALSAFKTEILATLPPPQPGARPAWEADLNTWPIHAFKDWDELWLRLEREGMTREAAQTRAFEELLPYAHLGPTYRIAPGVIAQTEPGEVVPLASFEPSTPIPMPTRPDPGPGEPDHAGDGENRDPRSPGRNGREPRVPRGGSPRARARSLDSDESLLF